MELEVKEMAGAKSRLETRNEARKALDALFREPGRVEIVHYSCESFYDRVDGRSPRITSIAVRNVASLQTMSFSIHQVAERRGVGFGEIEEHYDELEARMLEEFYACVRTRAQSKWAHWNMRDINYGFLALEHRLRVLGGTPEHISESNLVDIARLLIDIYGPQYAPNPRLENAMTINNISSRHFLSGAEEAQAFESKEYVKLHQSTLKKVDVIQHLAERAWYGTLKTKASWQDQYGTKIGGIVEAATDHWAYKGLGFLGIVGSLIALALTVFGR
ncbi:MAG: hypothetical protein ACYC1C_00350 [Chloroflexota bacterium]